METFKDKKKAGGLEGAKGSFPMWALHAVIVDKKEGLSRAKQIAQEFIKDPNKTFYRETMDSYRFRNIPKTKFAKFRTKVISPTISLVYGTLKKNSGNM